MNSAVLVAVGDELLGGLRREENCAFLARHLHDAGWTVERLETIPDGDEAILDVLGRWVGRTDLLVLSGGLGPTHDDRTRSALARYLGCPLRSDSLYDKVVGRCFGERRLLFERTRDTQSMIPEAARAVYNPEGSALGIAFSRDSTRVLALPGVPMEYAAMARQELPDLFAGSCRWASVIVLGLPETVVVERIPEVVGDGELHVSVLPAFPQVELVIRGDPVRVADAEALVRSRFSDALPLGCRSLAEAVLWEARRQGRTVTAAESCTGGLLQGALTEVPGSSEVFRGGVVTYSDEMKERLLGVPRGLLEEFGAVSQDCAEAMARGGLWFCGVDFSVAVTGVAGPGGGTPLKPVGGVWFGLASRRKNGRAESRAFHCLFRGGREEVRRSAVSCAMAELWRMVRDGRPSLMPCFEPGALGDATA
ncbi:Putative competence-damage inducible protein [Fretibacterium fastidiosum]|uniref:nicotinamide-nucleotide amidohydrolase family protein n=2 Tax=Fretibacterium fastidiosum TaxID=651822 RepID=UPI0038FD0F7B